MRTAEASGEPIVLFPSELALFLGASGEQIVLFASELAALFAKASGELPILVPSELVCCTVLVKFDSLARGLGVAAADFTTLFLPEPLMAGFNSPLFRSFLRMLGLDCEIGIFFSQVVAFSGVFCRLWPTTGGALIRLVPLTSGLAGV